MPQRENLNTLDLDVSLTPTQLTATKSDCTIIDTQGFESVTFFVHVEAASTADDDNYFTVSLEAGDTAALTDAAAVSGDALIGSNVVLNDTSTGVLGKVGYRGDKRYVRPIPTETGTADLTIGLYAVKGHPLSAPVS